MDLDGMSLVLKMLGFDYKYLLVLDGKLELGIG